MPVSGLTRPITFSVPKSQGTLGPHSDSRHNGALRKDAHATGGAVEVDIYKCLDEASLHREVDDE